MAANTAINVLGADAINARLNRLRYTPNNRNILRARLRATLGRAIRAIVNDILRTCPVITGRLYRSFRFQVAGDSIRLTFRAPYAWRVNETSRRNKRYMERGLRRGISKANIIGKQPSQSGVTLVFKRRGPIQRAPNGGIVAVVAYEGIL